MYNTKGKSGFTLVELMLVISIIGVISTITLGVINVPEWQQRARDTVRKEDVSTISGALERFYSDNNSYPTAVLNNQSPAIVAAVPATLSPNYIKTIPNDPESGINYYYVTDGQNYCVCTHLYASNAETQINGCNLTINSLVAPAPHFCVTNPF